LSDSDRRESIYVKVSDAQNALKPNRNCEVLTCERKQTEES